MNVYKDSTEPHKQYDCGRQFGNLDFDDENKDILDAVGNLFLRSVWFRIKKSPRPPQPYPKTPNLTINPTNMPPKRYVSHWISRSLDANNYVGKYSEGSTRWPRELPQDAFNPVSCAPSPRIQRDVIPGISISMYDSSTSTPESKFF